MIYSILFLLSIVIQLTAALYALLLIRLTGRKSAWIFISLAMVLMVSRRIVTFISLYAAGKKMNFDIAELIALVISCLMLLGVLRIREYFRSINTAEAERKRAERKIRVLNEELERKVEERTKQLLDAQEELVRKEKLSILGQLAGSLGHELRNPLGVINNAVYYLKTVLAGDDEKVKEYLTIIKSEVDTSGRIISDLLDFSRAKAPQTRPVPLTELMDQSLARCTIPGTVTVTIDIPETLPSVYVDPLQMGQVFQNLIVNAIQAMPEGGSVHVHARRVSSLESQVSCSDQRPETRNSELHTDLVEISVADTGIGIKPEDMAKIYQPLFTTKARGIGLGLTVSRKNVEAANGRLTVDSRPGKGATFTVTLPAGEDAIWKNG
jgi:signal transduction histidine kinase